MHSSRMRTVRYSGRLGVCLGGGRVCLPDPPLPRGQKYFEVNLYTLYT